MSSRLAAHWKGLRKEGLVIPLGVMGLWAAALVVVRRDAQLATQLVFGFQALVPLLAGILAAGLVVGDPALELLLSTASSPFRFLVGRLAALLATVFAAALAFEGLALALGAFPARAPGQTWSQWFNPLLAFRPPAGAPLAANLVTQALLGAGFLLASHPWLRRPERYL